MGLQFRLFTGGLKGACPLTQRSGSATTNVESLIVATIRFTTNNSYFFYKGKNLTYLY